jgi:S-DNA-T family DNA segregation ATPase FtsK/SpoIIIE
MATKIFLPSSDLAFIESLKSNGLGVPKAYHWIIARLAIARSLQLPQFPSNTLERPNSQEIGREIHMEQLTGENSPVLDDYTDHFRLLLSIYHNEDLFADRDRFGILLQKHLQRGLEDIRNSWRSGNDFYDWLYQEMFPDRSGPVDGAARTDSGGGEKIRRALAETGISATIEGNRDGPRLSLYDLRLSSADDLTRLRRDLEKVQFELGLNKALMLTDPMGERRIGLHVPRPDSTWWTPPSQNIPDWVRDDRYKGLALPLCAGVDVGGTEVVFDMKDAVHLFVAGTTGSGKSVCLHSLLLSMLAGGRDVRLCLIDPKEVEFAAYKACSRLWRPVATEVADAAEMLGDLIAEMDARQKRLSEVGAQNIDEANAHNAGLPRIVLVVDELADLLLQRPETEESLVRLAQKARAVGIHLILATQRPASDIFSGQLRSNIPSRIALSVRTAQESRIILDETGAERLLGKGDMLMRLAAQDTMRVHGLRVEAGDLRRWM